VLVVVDNAAQARAADRRFCWRTSYMSFRSTAPTTARVIWPCFRTSCPSGSAPSAPRAPIFAETALEWGGLYVSLGDPELADAKYPLLAQSGVRFRAENSDGAANFFYRDKTISSLEE
jgi:hypothetical protein